MTLKKIVLELARTPEFPEGNPAIGYEFQAPLAADGSLDMEGWKAEHKNCTVNRIENGKSVQSGLLVHHRGNNWIFDYDTATRLDDEPLFRFDRHHFVEGEYISITEHDGQDRPYKIIRVA